MSMNATIGLAFAAIALLCGSAFAQDGPRPKVAVNSASESEIARFCGNIAPTAAEARVAYETRRLTELETRIKQEIDDLESKEARVREWVTRRDALTKSATDDVVAIYAKMSAEAAAAQIAAMEEPVAAAILGRLNPRNASAILGEMEADKAAKLTSLMAGQSGEEKKS
jgi:flagellar motility protein MotE (MotC chaperone)